MEEHKPHDEEWLAAALAIGTLSRSEIARHVGLGPDQAGRIDAGWMGPDLKARIEAMRVDLDRDARLAAGVLLHPLVAAAYVKALVARCIKLGLAGDGEDARKCREFINDMDMGFGQYAQGAEAKAGPDRP